MQAITNSTIEKTLLEAGLAPASNFAAGHVLYYLGLVNYATSERVLMGINAHLKTYGDEELCLVVTSAGGPSGTGMSFYDTVRLVLKPRLTTVGAGDIDSAGLIIFLAGTKRYITPHTTSLLHKAGRVFESNKRYTSQELFSMAKEDELKDVHYASVVAANSQGKLTTKKVLGFMEKSSVLLPEDLIRYGLAEKIIL